MIVPGATPLGDLYLPTVVSVRMSEGTVLSKVANTCTFAARNS